MGRYDKLIFQILRGTSDANISFPDLINLLQHFGFEMRVKGSHHIFRKKGIEEKQIYRKKGVRQNHIKSNRYETLSLNIDWEAKIDK